MTLSSVATSPTATVRWLTRQDQKASETALRLFCFPYAGGGASVFRPWVDAVSSNIHVHAAQLPGRENKIMEPPFTRLELMVEAIAESIIPLLDRPYAFFGHSMGALISFELARRLRLENVPQPVHLFLSGRQAPQVPPDTETTYDLPDSKFIDELRRLNGTPKEVFEHPELLPMILPLLRADFSVCQTYSYKHEAPLNCLITVISGLEDELLKVEMLDPWSEQTTASCRVCFFPGDHFYLHAARSQVLRLITQSLYPLHQG
jgi:medium-chain acyl-[acyl-carrier-protein] hydrolase